MKMQIVACVQLHYLNELKMNSDTNVEKTGEVLSLKMPFRIVADDYTFFFIFPRK